MTLIITSAVPVKKAGSVRNRQRIDCIDARDTSGLDGNRCLFIDLMSVIFIRILDIRTGLYVILMKERARIAFRSGDVLQPVNFLCGQ